MLCATVLIFDDETDARIRGAWAVLADAGAVFLGVTPTAALFDLHRRVDSVCDAASATIHEWYRPDGWVPHVSLAFGLDADGLAEAVRCLAGLELKTVARAESLLLVTGDETGWTDRGAVPLVS